MKKLLQLEKKIEEMYSSIPCKNCIVLPTCVNLGLDDILSVDKKCKEFFDWLTKTKIQDFWDVHYSNPIMRDKRREVLRKLF